MRCPICAAAELVHDQEGEKGVGHGIQGTAEVGAHVVAVEQAQAQAQVESPEMRPASRAPSAMFFPTNSFSTPLCW